MKRWQKIALAVGVLAVAGASIAWGGRQAGRRHFMKYMIGARIEEALDYVEATPQQRAVVGDAKKAIMARVQAQREAHRGKVGEIAALLAADTLDVAKIEGMVDRKADELRSTARAVIGEIAKVHAALTPAQRQKLYQRWQERHARHHGWGGEE